MLHYLHKKILITVCCLALALVFVALIMSPMASAEEAGAVPYADNAAYITYGVSGRVELTAVEDGQVAGDIVFEGTDLTFTQGDEITFFYNEAQYPSSGTINITGSGAEAFEVRSGKVAAVKDAQIERMVFTITPDGNLSVQIALEQQPAPVAPQVMWSGTFESVFGSPMSTDITVTANGVDDLSVSGIPQENAPAGSYILTAVSASGAELSGNTHIYTVLPKEVAVTWSETLTNVYGEPVAQVSATFQGVDGQVSALVSGLPQQDDDAGNYILTATTDNANYKLTGAMALYTITPKTITAEEISWSGEFESEYGNAPNALTATVNGVTITVKGLPSARSDAGEYEVFAALDDKNYVLEKTSYRFVVKPKHIDSVTWSETLTSVYGEPVAQVSATFQGVDGQVSALVSGLPRQGDDADEYELTATSSNGNYVITAAPAKYVISQKQVDVVWSGVFESVYGEQTGHVTAAFDGILAQINGLPESGDGVKEEGYTLTAVSNNKNYVLSNTTHIYRIVPKDVEVVWSAVTGVYGEEHAVTATFADIEAQITGTMPDKRAEVGTYPLTATTSNVNYKLVGATLNYQVTAKEVSVIWDGTFTSVYGSAPDVTVYANGVDGERVRIDVASMPTAQTDAGTYVLIASTQNKNYLLTGVEHTYTITPKTVQVEWGGAESSMLGETPGKVSATVSGVDLEIAVQGMPDANSEAGVYILTAVTDNANYILTNNTIAFEVKDNALPDAVGALGDKVGELESQLNDIKEENAAQTDKLKDISIAALALICVLFIVIIVILALLVLLLIAAKKDDGKQTEILKKINELLCEIKDETQYREIGIAIGKCKEDIDNEKNQLSVRTGLNDDQKKWYKEFLDKLFNEIISAFPKYIPEIGEEFDDIKMWRNGHEGNVVTKIIEVGRRIGKIIIIKAHVQTK